MTRLAVFASVALAGTVLATAVADAASLHERKEVAGLAIVFGAEPEPALTDEMQFLRWRVNSLSDEEPYTEIRGASVMVTHDGEEFGPFAVRGTRRDPGLYQTRHIFTAAGQYETVLTFRKGEETETHSVDFTFRIGDRASLELPPRKKGGGSS